MVTFKMNFVFVIRAEIFRDFSRFLLFFDGHGQQREDQLVRNK